MPLVDRLPDRCLKCGALPPNIYPEDRERNGHATRIVTLACLICGTRFMLAKALDEPTHQRRRQPSHGKTRL